MMHRGISRRERALHLIAQQGDPNGPIAIGEITWRHNASPFDLVWGAVLYSIME